jgi:hypothetical protein
MVQLPGRMISVRQVTEGFTQLVEIGVATIPHRLAVNCPSGHYLFHGELLRLPASGRIAFIPDQDAIDHPVNGVHRVGNSPPHAEGDAAYLWGTSRLSFRCTVTGCDFDAVAYEPLVTALACAAALQNDEELRLLV